MFHSKAQIVRRLMQCHLRRSIMRALHDLDGTLTLLGGFNHIPPGNSAGFIMDVTSRHGQTWHVALCIVDFGNVIVRVVKEVPWHEWAGKCALLRASTIALGCDGFSVYDGENPDEAYKKKIRSQSKRTVTGQGMAKRPTSVGLAEGVVQPHDLPQDFVQLDEDRTEGSEVQDT